MSAGTRGKWSEGEVQKVLQSLEGSNSNFTFNRNLDARAARGKFPVQTGDYQAFYRAESGEALNYVIEVKEIEMFKAPERAHRLDYKSMSVDSVARMRRRELAGSIIIILLCHRLTTRNCVWRSPSFSFFKTREAKTPSGSWVVQDFPEIKLTEYLEETLIY